MTLVHLFPIPIEKTSLVIQLTSMLALMATLYYVKAIAALLTSSSRFATLLAPTLTAFYFPLNNWATVQGTEVSILCLLLTASTYLVIKALQGHLSLFLFVLLALGTLVRLDFSVPAVAHILMLLIFDPKERVRILTRGIPLFLLIVLPATGLRWYYYGDYLPNTYYLKMTGYPVLQRVTRGIYITLKEINPVLLLTPFFFTFLTRNRMALVLLGIFSTHLAYSMYIGGDAWEWFGGANRFLAIAMPIFFILLTQTFHALRTMVNKRRLLDSRQYARVEQISLLLLFLLLNTGSDNMLLYLTLAKPVETQGQNATQVRMARSLNQIAQPQATIGIVQAGVTPYFSPERRYVDLLGRSNKDIAHEQSRQCTSCGPLQIYLAYWPGHMKWDYNFVVTRLKPDIFGQVFPSSELVYLKSKYTIYISRERFEFYVRNGTTKLHL